MRTFTTFSLILVSAVKKFPPLAWLGAVEGDTEWLARTEMRKSSFPLLSAQKVLKWQKEGVISAIKKDLLGFEGKPQLPPIIINNYILLFTIVTILRTLLLYLI